MLKAILVDDEKPSIRTLRRDLSDYCPRVDVVARCEDALEAIDAINEHQPDIVFLDITMPGMSGFEMLESIGDINFYVIFISKHKDQALKAFDIRNANYLNKPIDPDKLVEAVNRVEEQIELRLGKPFPENDMDNQLCHAIKWIPFQVGTDYVCIKRDDIIYFHADGDYTSLYLDNSNIYSHKGNKRILINDGLGVCQKRLSAYGEFFRIHHSFMVNLNHVVHIKTGDKNIQLSDGKELSISVSKWPTFLDLIKGDRI